jgi:hypothetical protein
MMADTWHKLRMFVTRKQINVVKWGYEISIFVVKNVNMLSNSIKRMRIM